MSGVFILLEKPRIFTPLFDAGGCYVCVCVCVCVCVEGGRGEAVTGGRVSCCISDNQLKILQNPLFHD